MASDGGRRPPGTSVMPRIAENHRIRIAPTPPSAATTRAALSPERLGDDPAERGPDEHRRHRQDVVARCDPPQQPVLDGRLADRDRHDVERGHRAVRQDLLRDQAGEADQGRVRRQRDERVADRDEDGGADEEPPDPKPPNRPPGDRGADERRQPSDRGDQPDHAGREADVGREHEVDRAEHAPEPGDRGIGQGQRAEHRVAERQARPSRISRRTGSRSIAGGAAGSSRRIERRNTADTMNESASRAIATGAVSSWIEPAADPEPDELGRRAAAGQGRVGLDEPVATDDGRQVGPIGGVEERREDRRAKRDEDQVQERRARRARRRPGCSRAAAPARGRPRSGSAAVGVGRPRRRRTARPSSPADQLGAAQDRDLASSGAEHEDRRERQRGPRDERAQHRNRRRGPQPGEVAVAPDDGIEGIGGA